MHWKNKLPQTCLYSCSRVSSRKEFTASHRNSSSRIRKSVHFHAKIRIYIEWSQGALIFLTFGLSCIAQTRTQKVLERWDCKRKFMAVCAAPANYSILRQWSWVATSAFVGFANIRHVVYDMRSRQGGARLCCRSKYNLHKNDALMLHMRSLHLYTVRTIPYATIINNMIMPW